MPQDYRELNDMADELDDVRRQLKEAQGRVSTMVLNRDPAKMDEAALQAALRIEDIFARGFDNATQRRAVIQIAIRSVIQDAIGGGKSDN